MLLGVNVTRGIHEHKDENQIIWCNQTQTVRMKILHKDTKHCISFHMLSSLCYLLNNFQGHRKEVKLSDLCILLSSAYRQNQSIFIVQVEIGISKNLILK